MLKEFTHVLLLPKAGGCTFILKKCSAFLLSLKEITFCSSNDSHVMGGVEVHYVSNCFNL